MQLISYFNTLLSENALEAHIGEWINESDFPTLPMPHPGRIRSVFAPLLLRFSSAPIEAEQERRWSGANTPQIRRRMGGASDQSAIFVDERQRNAQMPMQRVMKRPHN